MPRYYTSVSEYSQMGPSGYNLEDKKLIMAINEKLNAEIDNIEKLVGPIKYEITNTETIIIPAMTIAGRTTTPRVLTKIHIMYETPEI